MADRSLRAGKLLAESGFHDEAGRSAYIAAFQATQAILLSRRGKAPRSHSGTHSELHRLGMEEPEIGRQWPTFVAQAYELKAFTDYGQVRQPTPAEVAEALDRCGAFLGVVQQLLAKAPPGSG